MTLIQIIIIASGFIVGLSVSIVSTYVAGKRKKKVEDTYDPKNTTFVFSGNLKQANLLDTVQLLEIGRREGVLHIYCGRRKGYLTFLRGKIIDAFYRNYTGREAILQMFDIDEGDFYFEPKKIYQPQMITESILDLAFEWDERKQRKTGDK